VTFLHSFTCRIVRPGEQRGPVNALLRPTLFITYNDNTALHLTLYPMRTGYSCVAGTSGLLLSKLSVVFLSHLWQSTAASSSIIFKSQFIIGCSFHIKQYIIDIAIKLVLLKNLQDSIYLAVCISVYLSILSTYLPIDLPIYLSTLYPATYHLSYIQGVSRL
jgi:hypothetical protein